MLESRNRILNLNVTDFVNMPSTVSVGERIRLARTARRLSLSEVADLAEISVATLSRIERDKQGLGLGLFLVLSRILNASPRDLIGGEAEIKDPLLALIGGLDHDGRVRLWRDLAAERPREPRRASRGKLLDLGDEVDELIAQLEFVRAKMERVRAGVRRR